MENPAELEQFKLMCEKYFSNSYYILVKTRAELNSKSIIERKYSKETKQFALMLHFFRPKCHLQVLEQTWCLPIEECYKDKPRNWDRFQ